MPSGGHFTAAKPPGSFLDLRQGRRVTSLGAAWAEPWEAVGSVFSSWGGKETNDADNAEQSRKKRQRGDSAVLRGTAS